MVRRLFDVRPLIIDDKNYSSDLEKRSDERKKFSHSKFTPWKMKIAIMQPYIFPYIGYFQLINAVEMFVVHDDVQYIQRGWINRNRILMNEKDLLFTLPVRKAAVETPINEIFFAEGIQKEKAKILSQIQNSYRKAPYFREVFLLIEQILKDSEENISVYTTNQLQQICAFLEIKTPFVLSSDLAKNNNLKGEERVIEINKVLNATHYINPIGGVELYHQKHFEEANLKLNFIKTRSTKYAQFGNEFIPFLSIIDVMMFNSVAEIKVLLNDFDLV